MFKLIVQSLWFCSTCLQTAFAQEWRKFFGSPEVLLSDFSPCPGISALARLWIPTRFQCGNARWKNHSLELQVSEAKLKTTLMHAEASRWEYFNNFWKYLYISFCFSWTLKYFSVAWDRARWTCVPWLGERGRAASSWGGKAGPHFFDTNPGPAYRTADGGWLKAEGNISSSDPFIIWYAVISRPQMLPMYCAFSLLLVLNHSRM